MRIAIRSAVVIVVAVLTILSFAGCMTMGLRAGELKDDRGGSSYLKEAYGEVSRMALYFTFEEDFATSMRLYKEGILADAKLSEKEKEQRFADLKDVAFVENGYLVYFFRLKAPALVKMNEFKFTFNDKSGKSLIKKIVPTSNKVSVTYSDKYSSETTHSYNYAWFMQLHAPFTAANYPEGEYSVEIEYPNGSKAVYMVENRK